MKNIILHLFLLFIMLNACKSEKELDHEKYKVAFEYLSSKEVYKKFVGVNLRQFEDTAKYQIQSSLFQMVENYVDTFTVENGELNFVNNDKTYYSSYYITQLKELILIMNDLGIKKVTTFYHDENTDVLSMKNVSNNYWLIFKFNSKYQLNYLNLKKERVTRGVLLYSWYDDNWVLGANIY